jgi:hypothetical protein
MADASLTAAAASSPPSVPGTSEKDSPLSTAEVGGVAAVSQDAAGSATLPYRQTEAPCHSAESQDSDTHAASAGKELRGGAVSPPHVASLSSDHTTLTGGSQPNSVPSAPLKQRVKTEAFAVNATGATPSLSLDAAALSSPLTHAKPAAATAEDVTSVHLVALPDDAIEAVMTKKTSGIATAGGALDEGGSGGEMNASVATPRDAPALYMLSMRPKPQCFATLSEDRGREGHQEDLVGPSVAVALPEQSGQGCSTAHTTSSSREPSSPLAATTTVSGSSHADHDVKGGRELQYPSSPQQQQQRQTVQHIDSSSAESDGSLQRTLSKEEADEKHAPLNSRKRRKGDDGSGEDEDDEEDEEVRNVPPWCTSGRALSDAAGRQKDICGSKGQADPDVARALAAFSSSLLGATAPHTKARPKPSLSPRHSYAPWRISESNGHDDDDGGQVTLPSFDGVRVSSTLEHAKSPPPPKQRTWVGDEAAPGKGRAEAKPLGRVAKAKGGGGASTSVGLMLTSPRGELSVGASASSDPAVVDSGSYVGSGCLDADTVVAAANVPAARFGGGGILRHNPANLTFSGSGSGSQGGDGTIDRSMSSHFSVPSRGAASLSPPYLAVDEESGELAVVFRRDGLGREQRHHGGSPNSPFTASSFAAVAAAGAPLRNGEQTSPSHQELSNTLGETFGTIVSTMSTTFSTTTTTTNSVGDGESSSPGDALRLQMAAQMRQALLQTLGLNVGGSSGVSANASNQGRQRSEKAASLTSMTASIAEATTSSGAVLPLSPLRESCSASANSYVPRLPHLGQAVNGGGGISGTGGHVIVTPPMSSGNTSSAAVNLASSASLSTNSTTSPTAGAQSRSVAATFASPNSGQRNMQSAGVSGVAHANPAFFDIDSGAEEEVVERRSDGGADLLRTSMSEEGSHMLSLSVSNPLVCEDLPSSEISTSQQLSAAVQPPPNLQLAYSCHRHNLTENFSDVVACSRSPVTSTPTCFATKTSKTIDDIFCSSTSTLLPPVLKSMARAGGEQAAALEAAAAEAMQKLNNCDYTVNDDDKGERGQGQENNRHRMGVVQPPSLVLSPTACVHFTTDSDGNNIRTSPSPGISPLSIEDTTGKRHTSSRATHPLGRPSASAQRVPPSRASQDTATKETEAAKTEDESVADAKEGVVTATTRVPSALKNARNSMASIDDAARVHHATSAAVAIAPPTSTPKGEVSEAIPVTGLEWSSHSLSMSARTRHYRGEDGTNSVEDDDVSGTATTRAPNSTSSSQFQIYPVGSTNFSEAPELLQDAGPTSSHSRRDLMNSSAALSSISSAIAAVTQQAPSLFQVQPQQQQSHADPAGAGIATPGVMGGTHDAMVSRPGSTMTTTTNGDLSASTSTWMWSDGIASTTAGAALLRRYGDDALRQEDTERPVMPQRYGQFASVPVPRFNSAAVASCSDGDSVRRCSNTVTLLDIDDGDEVGTPRYGQAATSPHGATSSPPQQRQTPSSRSSHVGAATSVFEGNEKEQEGMASQVGQGVDENDMWGEPTTSSHQQQQEHRKGTAEEDDDFTEPTKAPIAERVEKHVRFADPSATQFTDPPSSPWADGDYFFDPDYTHMEFKNVAEDNNRGVNEEAGGRNDGAIDDDNEAEILREVPHFRFKHRCGDVHGSPVPLTFIAPSAPSWAAWSRGADSSKTNMKRTASEDEGPLKTTREADLHDESEGAGERAPRVFFTKERLASRAALMEARRAALQRTDGAAKTAKEESPSAEAKQSTPAANSGSGLRISLAPPLSAAPAAAMDAPATISITLPNFAAPVTSTPSSGETERLLSRPPPPPAEGGHPRAPTNRQAEVQGDNRNDARNDSESDDGFGGWVQQGTAPQQTKNDTDVDSFSLTREWCAQVAAEVKQHGRHQSCDVAAISVDATRVVEVLRTVFGDDPHLLLNVAFSPHPSSNNTSVDASAACVASDHRDGDEASKALGVATSTVLSVSGEVRGVEGVLEALSFTSLAQRSGAAASATGSFATTPVAASATDQTNGTRTYTSTPSMMADGGFVVPWRARTSAATCNNGATQAAVNEARAAGGTATKDADSTVDGGEEESSRLRLTRHLLFPGQQEMEGGSGTPFAAARACPVSTFMGTRRLPDAPAVAQWTERDVVLAVQQEQRRMAQEHGGAVETERLEDILRLSS